MIDIALFIKSLKISWIKRLYWSDNSVTWANAIKENLPPICDLVCYGTAKLKVVNRKLRNQFWCDVINAWADFCLDSRKRTDHVLTDNIWFSDHTKSKTGIVKDWNRKVLRFIADIYCKNSGSILEMQTLCNTFKINMTFLCYASLIKT